MLKNHIEISELVSTPGSQGGDRLRLALWFYEWRVEPPHIPTIATPGIIRSMNGSTKNLKELLRLSEIILGLY